MVGRGGQDVEERGYGVKLDFIFIFNNFGYSAIFTFMCWSHDKIAYFVLRVKIEVVIV